MEPKPLHACFLPFAIPSHGMETGFLSPEAKRLVRNRGFLMGIESPKIEWGLKIERAREPLALAHALCLAMQITPCTKLKSLILSHMHELTLGHLWYVCMYEKSLIRFMLTLFWV